MERALPNPQKKIARQKLKVKNGTILEEYEPNMIIYRPRQINLKKKRLVECRRRKG